MVLEYALLDILLGILSNIISDDVQRILDDGRYRKAIQKRIVGLRDRVARACGEDGVALLEQAAACVSKAAFTQEQIINQAALNPVSLFTQLAEKSRYKAKIRSMLPYDRDRFSDFCKRILGFICREIPRLDDAHGEIAAENLFPSFWRGWRLPSRSTCPAIALSGCGPNTRIHSRPSLWLLPSRKSCYIGPKMLSTPQWI